MIFWGGDGGYHDIPLLQIKIISFSSLIHKANVLKFTET
jgi:hypothetical protein